MEPKVDLLPAPEGKGEGEEVFITVSDASTSVFWVIAKLVPRIAAAATASPTTGSAWPRMIGPKPHW